MERKPGDGEGEDADGGSELSGLASSSSASQDLGTAAAKESTTTSSETSSRSPPVFEPKPELVAMITGMGYSQNAAIKALFYTGNYSADLAVGWLLENEGTLNLDGPLQDSLADSEDSDNSEVGAGEFEEHKMVMVVNMELKMGVGKVAAQAAHAAVALYRLMVDDQDKYGNMLLAWSVLGEMKVVVKGQSAAHLTQLAAAAAARGLPHYLVQDAGRTQIAPGSVTVLGIMGRGSDVDTVTGGLKLL